jgi:hypothetical protein
MQRKIEYDLIKERYQKLVCKDNKNIVKELSMYGFGDVIDFEIETYSIIDWHKAEYRLCTNFGLTHIKEVFPKMGSYERVHEIPDKDLKQFADWARKKLHISIFKKSHILEELIALRETQKQLLSQGRIIFPELSKQEIEWAGMW